MRCSLAPFVHWFYSVGGLTRFAIKSYLFGNDKMEAEVTDYLNTASREDNQLFVDYYGKQPLIVQALYLRFIKEVDYCKNRGLHESDNFGFNFLYNKVTRCFLNFPLSRNSLALFLQTVSPLRGHSPNSQSKALTRRMPS